MPEIGEIKKGFDAGKNYKQFVTWVACVRCGKERWVILSKGRRPRSSFCGHCGVIVGMATRGGRGIPFGEAHYNWKGGYINRDGYRVVTLLPDSPYITMARKDNSVFEHRLVMAKKLGRCLLRSEVVHHRPDVAKDDNREEVLYLMPNSSDHSKLSACSNCELKKEIRLLRWEVKQLLEITQGKLLITTDPQATIATDLDAVLKEEK
ncbi:hypothetical protein LCGC14_1745650 [marine sediment metagenome]|uniref:HNH nuclease domain-containing protein n=1 Tax=marine sediment metagenome TaxID=412755 RepID=A0A0F9HSZ4_9ZZZZ